MSRVFGYSDSVYNIYNDLNNSKILKYKKDNNKTSWDDVINSIKEIDFYIPLEFKKNMKNNKIRVVRAPSLFNRNTIISTPTEENEDPTIIFPSRSAMFIKSILIPDATIMDAAITCPVNLVSGCIPFISSKKQNMLKTISPPKNPSNFI